MPTQTTISCPHCSKDLRPGTIKCQHCKRGISPAHFKNCRYCGQVISRVAIKCKHCSANQSDLPSGDGPDNEEARVNRSPSPTPEKRTSVALPEPDLGGSADQL